MTKHLDLILDTEIIVSSHLDAIECDDLVKRLDICQEAKSQLLALKISWQDYLDLIEVAGVDIQDYLNITDENALVLGF
ncbi:hypothetical protein FJR11_04390 [Anabaena sp. UHCC 0187]|uniref:hypothetical protein n=1 Tax=Anabaena sp. UHCC 0187 TaxID=2590018 RepID=UPI00144735B9|nr:hypothetical protein [Anabaena sp. UHCC 0187]MTJ11846.1 hypothetical protein [Anabaena sp. UHCC 0187]